LDLLLYFKYLFPKALEIDFLRFFVIAFSVYFLFWIVLAKIVQGKLIEGKWPEKREVAREFLYSMGMVFIVALTGFWVYSAGPGLFKIYPDVSQYGWPYFWGSLLWIILLQDAYFYWTHRMMHHPWLFKHIHRIHHLSKNPSPWAAYAFHPVEAVVHAGFLPLYLLFFPTHPIVVALFLYHMIIRNVWLHLGLEFFPKGFTRHPFLGWITTSTHHSLHHMYSNSDYTFYFTFWDRVMGTLDKRYHDSFEKIAGKSFYKPSAVEKNKT
jgi:Delta7-sterol 5-desaturase